MNNRKKFDMAVSVEALKPDNDVDRIKCIIDTLIEALFIPVLHSDLLTKRDPVRCERFGISDKEPINWGKVRCIEVKAFRSNTYLVLICGAAPGTCPTLCSYIEIFMASYGWSVEVNTE